MEDEQQPDTSTLKDFFSLEMGIAWGRISKEELLHGRRAIEKRYTDSVISFDKLSLNDGTTESEATNDSRSSEEASSTRLDQGGKISNLSSITDDDDEEEDDDDDDVVFVDEYKLDKEDAVSSIEKPNILHSTPMGPPKYIPFRTNPKFTYNKTPNIKQKLSNKDTINKTPEQHLSPSSYLSINRTKNNSRFANVVSPVALYIKSTKIAYKMKKIEANDNTDKLDISSGNDDNDNDDGVVADNGSDRNMQQDKNDAFIEDELPVVMYRPASKVVSNPPKPIVPPSMKNFIKMPVITECLGRVGTTEMDNTHLENDPDLTNAFNGTNTDVSYHYQYFPH